MRVAVLLLSVFSLFACVEPAEPEIKTGLPPGSVDGGVMTAIKIASNITLGGAAIAADGKGQAKETFRLTLRSADKQPVGSKAGQMFLTLADGTVCSQAPRQVAQIAITNGEVKSFKTEVTGNLVCGPSEDKTIAYTASLNRKPQM